MTPELLHIFLEVIPWVLGVLLPSIIVGLTNAPQQKNIWGVLKIVLERISILTHRDSPGTLKLPGTTKNTPKACEENGETAP